MIPRLHRPVPQAINKENPFGQPDPAYTGLGLAGHPGVDFLCPLSSDVDACDSGRVESAGAAGTAGNMVVLRHSWGRSRYLHLTTWVVNPGQAVARGQLIGYSGSTGMSTGPHLHWDIYPHGEPYGNGYGGRVDPVPYLEGNGVSLEGNGVSLEGNGVSLEGTVSRLRGYAAELSRARAPSVARRRTIADELRHDAETLEPVLP